MTILDFITSIVSLRPNKRDTGTITIEIDLAKNKHKIIKPYCSDIP